MIKIKNPGYTINNMDREEVTTTEVDQCKEAIKEEAEE